MKPFQKPEFTMFNNYILDHIMPDLPPNAWKVLCVAIRQTIGWVDETTESGRKERDIISWSQFKEKTGIGSYETLRNALFECLGRKYLLRTKVGEHPGTKKPLFEYRLNTEYEVATTETVVAATTENVAGSTTGTVVTKEQQIDKQNVGVVLTEEEQTSLKLLTEIGVTESAARELAQTCEPQLIETWIGYAQKAKSLTDKPAFVVSKLRAGETPPQKRTKKQDRRRYIEGKYADYIEH